MQLELTKIRESYGMTCSEFAKILDMSEVFYSRYEQRGELPSKYAYILWKKLKKFPLPDDFFYYTSFTLAVNMKYHGMTQKDIANFLDIANQSTISGYLQENIPMYEKKEYFLKFDPFIIPMASTVKGGDFMLRKITDIEAKGNFVLVEKRRLQKIRKLEKQNA